MFLPLLVDLGRAPISSLIDCVARRRLTGTL